MNVEAWTAAVADAMTEVLHLLGTIPVADLSAAEALEIDADLDLLGRDIRTMRGMLAQHIAERVDRNAAPSDRVINDAVWEMYGGGPHNVRYDNDKVIARLGAVFADECFAAADPETGEIVTPPPSVIAADITARMAALTGAGTPSFDNWRKTPMKALGVNLAAFEVEREGKAPFTIRWHR